jgi:peroxiredoxin
MESADIDVVVRNAWREVRQFWNDMQAGRSTREDDPQPRLASLLFRRFEEEADANAKRKAVTAAFMMWGNTGHAGAADEAIATLDVSADYWGHVLHGISNAYARSGRRSEIVPLLHRFEQLLTHPKSRAAVLLDLGRYYLRTQPDAAAPFYAEVVRLAPDRQSILQAEGALYELQSLCEGHPAPDFTATTVDGETISLAGFRGSVVCLDFWESGCGPCWAEFPVLRSLHAEYPPPLLQLIGISSDQEVSAMSGVVQKEGMVWPQIREEVRWQDNVVVFGPLRRAYNVWGVPTTILIDSSGRIAAKYLRGGDLIRAVKDIVER